MMSQLESAPSRHRDWPLLYTMLGQGNPSVLTNYFVLQITDIDYHRSI